ncbi:MAG: alpha-glucosidase/alpha-galactosidase [Candidatus Abyssubacteria bacterium]
MPKKIVIIGGGSYNWAPTIINDILLTPGLAGSHIVLEDISSEPLGAIQRLGEKMLADKESDCTLSSTTSEEEALEGADFVAVTISTGGFDAMQHDLEIPLKYGVNQTVGDTVGPGGLFRGLRSIPVMVGIARNMERLCPDAWLINYTNPMAALCLAVQQETSVKTLGLCHELQGVLAIVRSMLKLADSARMEYEVAGVNHFIWLLNLRIDGMDGFEMLRRWMQNPTPFTVPDQDVKEMFAPSTIDPARLKLELFEQLGYLPAAGDRHIAEFFDCYLRDFDEAEKRYGIKPTSIAERRDSWHAAMKAYVYGMLEGNFPIPAAKSSETISDIIAALAGTISPMVDILNILNEGQIENLPRGVIVETLGKVFSNGTDSLGPITLPGEIREMILPHAENQHLMVKAALEGDRVAAREFLERDPLCRNCSDLDQMLDELLEAHRKYLPTFG